MRSNPTPFRVLVTPFPLSEIEGDALLGDPTIRWFGTAVHIEVGTSMSERNLSKLHIFADGSSST